MEAGKSLFVGPAEIMENWGVSRCKAYGIIRELNEELKKVHPKALIIAGKVNRKWYEEACLINNEKETE